MGDLQTQQDSPLRPYGQTAGPQLPKRGSVTARIFVWSGVSVQLLLWGAILANESRWIPNSATEWLGNWAWLGCLGGTILAILAFANLKGARQPIDVAGFVASLVFGCEGTAVFLALSQSA